MDDEFVPRRASEQLTELVDSFRVLIVNGPRQAGKTTLLRRFRAAHGGEFRSFDDRDTLALAQEDPRSFVEVADRPLIIDEIQLGGDRVVRAIKLAVDSSRRRGQFILAGSTSFLTVPTISESLAGRAVFVDLWPLAMVERTGAPGRFVEQVFDEPHSLVGADSPWARDDYINLVVRGGFPEAVETRTSRALHAWFQSYVRTVVSRDIREFSGIGSVQALDALLELVAARSGTPLVVEDIGRTMALSSPTVKNYLSYLETVFLTTRVPFWSTNLTSRVTKTPKAFLTDSGLAASLLGATPEGLRQPGDPRLGGLVETFVFTELLKWRAMSAGAFEISHYRDRDGREVDFVLEGHDRKVVLIEVKASQSPSDGSDRHVRWLKQKLGDRCVAGIVFYLGEHRYSWGDGIYLMPISSLWDHALLP